MTPSEHLVEAEKLLECANNWGPGSDSAHGAAAQALAHTQLALAKVAQGVAWSTEIGHGQVSDD